MHNSNSFDKTLILMINCTSVFIACGMILFTIYTFVDRAGASNRFWDMGTVAHRITDLYTRFPL